VSRRGQFTGAKIIFAPAVGPLAGDGTQFRDRVSDLARPLWAAHNL